MRIKQLDELTIRSFHDGLISKRFSAREVVEEHLNAIDARNGEIGAYLSVRREQALAAAADTDSAVAAGGELDILAGVPLAVKDNIVMEGEVTTAGSKILETYIGAYDATVIKRLKDRRAVLVGKTNLDEFAMGSSTEHSAFQLTRNPHDSSRVPGGSSGGSAAAVAAGMALAALGSDTGGSIRQPASFCGVVGLRPTYGSVSRHGLIPMASSLDQIGPIARTVEDAGLLFRAIAGHDPFDSTSGPVSYEHVLAGEIDPSSFTVGLPREYFDAIIETEVGEAMQGVIKQLKEQGVSFKEVSLPHTRYGLSCYYLIVPAEVSSNLARYDGIRYGRISDFVFFRQSRESLIASEKNTTLADIYFKQKSQGFGDEPKRRSILGAFALSSGYYDAYYRKAQQVRTLISRDFEEAFKEVDVLLAPITPTRAFKIGEKLSDPLAMYAGDVMSIPPNLAGLPSISIPVGGVSGLPVGFQLIGKHWREADLFALGRAYEKMM